MQHGCRDGNKLHQAIGSFWTKRKSDGLELVGW